MVEEKISIRDKIRLIPAGKSRTFQCKDMLAVRSIQSAVSQVSQLYPNPLIGKYTTQVDRQSLSILVTAVPSGEVAYEN